MGFCRRSRIFLRRTILTLAREEGLTVQERTVDLTELYIADEVFVCGTSAGVAPVYEIDGRAIGTRETGPVTLTLRKRHQAALTSDEVHGWVSVL